MVLFGSKKDENKKGYKVDDILKDQEIAKKFLKTGVVIVFYAPAVIQKKADISFCSPGYQKGSNYQKVHYGPDFADWGLGFIGLDIF